MTVLAPLWWRHLDFIYLTKIRLPSFTLQMTANFAFFKVFFYII